MYAQISLLDSARLGSHVANATILNQLNSVHLYPETILPSHGPPK